MPVGHTYIITTTLKGCCKLSCMVGLGKGLYKSMYNGSLDPLCVKTYLQITPRFYGATASASPRQTMLPSHAPRRKRWLGTDVDHRLPGATTESYLARVREFPYPTKSVARQMLRPRSYSIYHCCSPRFALFIIGSGLPMA